MKQYFTWDSLLFTIIALGIIVTGSPILLMIFSFLAIVFLILKSGIKIEKKKPDDAGIWSWLVGSCFIGAVFFGFIGIGLVLFIFWFYVLIRYLTR